MGRPHLVSRHRGSQEYLLAFFSALYFAGSVAKSRPRMEYVISLEHSHWRLHSLVYSQLHRVRPCPPLQTSRILIHTLDCLSGSHSSNDLVNCEHLLQLLGSCPRQCTLHATIEGHPANKNEISLLFTDSIFLEPPLQHLPRASTRRHLHQ